jgi:hypothetical protein
MVTDKWGVRIQGRTVFVDQITVYQGVPLELTVDQARELAAELIMTARCSECCNPECGGNWGTGCYCCHFNHKAGEPRKI